MHSGIATKVVLWYRLFANTLNSLIVVTAVVVVVVVIVVVVVVLVVVVAFRVFDWLN